MAKDDDRTVVDWNGWQITLVSKQRGCIAKAQCLAQPDRWLTTFKLWPFPSVALIEIKRLIQEASGETGQ